MARPTFYYGTIKKTIVAFASIFNDLSYVDSNGDTIMVPLHYSGKEKFVDVITQPASDLDETKSLVTLPRMGFELVDMQFAPSRNLNPMSMIHEPQSDTNPDEFMYNRVSYDFFFTLYVGTKYFEDGLKIVEQILPFFSPELTVTINDMEGYNIKTNLTFVSTGSSFEIMNQGSLVNSRGIIMWTLPFTCKGYLYSNPRNAKRIKTAITDYHNADFNTVFDRLTAAINPPEANIDDAYTIVETAEELPGTDSIPPPDFDHVDGDFSGRDIFQT